MEARVAYGSFAERPRLTVVKDDGARYSALPHEIMRNRALSRDARLLYAILQGYWWGASGECTASHATLAADMDCSTRMLRKYLDELIDAELIDEREAGARRQKVYAPRSIGTGVPIERANEKRGSDSMGVSAQPSSDCDVVNRNFPTGQSELFDTSNRNSGSDSKKKTPEKKTKEEEEYRSIPVVAEVDAGASKPKAAKVAFGSLSESARLVVDDWRQKQGKPRPPQFNPTQAAYLEEAVADLGVDRLLEANTWAAQNGVPEFVKAIRAARTKRKRDEDDGVAPHVNGSASQVTTATDADRAIWARVLDDLRGYTSAGNFETYLAPLEVGGRCQDGGLCLIVPPSLAGAEMLGNYRQAIRRFLMDAGDPAPLAVAFKARRSKEPTHAG